MTKREWLLFLVMVAIMFFSNSVRAEYIYQVLHKVEGVPTAYRTVQYARHPTFFECREERARTLSVLGYFKISNVYILCTPQEVFDL